MKVIASASDIMDYGYGYRSELAGIRFSDCVSISLLAEKQLTQFYAIKLIAAL